MSKITASYLYSGLPDYWGGDGRRHDNDAGCLFAFYGAYTTLREIIDSAASDFCDGGDFYVHNDGDVDPWSDVSEDDVRAALLECLSEQGRADYDSNAISEFAQEYAACNDFDKCKDCGVSVGYPHLYDCAILADLAESGDIDDNYEVDVNVEQEDCEPDYDYCDSPIVVFLLEIEVCPDCGNPSGRNTHDGLCDKCERLHDVG